MVKIALDPSDAALAARAATIVGGPYAPSLEDWRTWCTWCSSSDDVGSWIQADPDDAIRFADDGYFEDGRWVCDDIGAGERLFSRLKFVYGQLRKQGMPVSTSWMDEFAVAVRTPAAPLDVETWRVVQRPREVEHWLDVRDNAMLYLAATLALRSGEIAALRPHHLQFHSGAWLIEVRSKSECRWMRVGRAGHSLLEWKGLREQLMTQHGIYRPEDRKLFDLHFGGARFLEGAEYVEHLVDGMIRKALVRADLQAPPISFASLCLSRARDLLDAGMTSEEAAYFFGWGRGEARDVWRLQARSDARVITFA